MHTIFIFQKHDKFHQHDNIKLIKLNLWPETDCRPLDSLVAIPRNRCSKKDFQILWP